MANDPIEITSEAARTLARGLYDEIHRSRDANGHDAPIAHIEVCRLLGDVYVHWVPVRLVAARIEGGRSVNRALEDVVYDWCFVNNESLVRDRHEFYMLLRFIQALICEAVAKEWATAIRRALTASDS